MRHMTSPIVPDLDGIPEDDDAEPADAQPPGLDPALLPAEGET